MDGEQPRGEQRSEQHRYDDIRVQGVLFGFHYVPLVSTRPLLTGPPKNLEQRATRPDNILVERYSLNVEHWLNGEIRVFSYSFAPSAALVVDR